MSLVFLFAACAFALVPGCAVACVGSVARSAPRGAAAPAGGAHRR